ncbi:MAG: alanine/glycine:cation symporter family protein [Coriobacteriales bacterium]
MEVFADAVAAVDSFVWGWALIWLLLGTHLIMTVRTGFIQRKLGTAIRLSVTKDDPHKSEGDISQFGALTTALASTIGTGNIVGVGTGLIFGGPGAIFWMWITGVFGIATKYSEVYIALKYRVKDRHGEMLGGAMYALERGFKHKGLGKVLGVLFALFTAIASFGIGASVQSNSLSGAIASTTLFDGSAIPSWVIGLVVVFLVGIVILGGIQSISRVCEKLVPLMAILYVAGCLIIICLNGQYVGEALWMILSCAFTGQAAFGGAVGSGVMLGLQYGFKRGLFSNESGLGSAPLVASSAVTRNPARQALVSMTGTFWDTVVICAITGIMLVSTMLSNPDIGQSILAAGSADAFGGGAALATACFEKIPIVGPLVLIIGLLSFTYSTMLGWAQYGNRAVTYLFGSKGVRVYQILFLVFVFWGCVSSGSLVWDISDITNALMAVPNCIAVLVLSGLVARETKYYVYEGHLDESDDTPVPQIDK